MSLKDTLRAKARANSIVKTASGMSEASKAMLYGIGSGIATAGISYGVPAAIESMRNARVRSNRDKLVGQMARAFPEIKNYSRRDVDLVFNSLAMHSPRVLKDPLVGGQTMLEALQRGNRMDVGALSSISKLTGGSGIHSHEQEAIKAVAGIPEKIRGAAKSKKKGQEKTSSAIYSQQNRYDAYRKRSKL